MHLWAQFNWKPTPIYNVVAKLQGSDFPGEWILRGNHYDGWVNGAEDPLAGMVAELEEARALGLLVRQGWRPRRTIVYLGWDAEEPGWWVQQNLWSSTAPSCRPMRLPTSTPTATAADTSAPPDPTAWNGW